jgi:hypothetical protein
MRRELFGPMLDKGAFRMNFMVFDIFRGLSRLRPGAAAPALCLTAVFAAAALMGASPARAQAPQEDTNPVNSVLGFFGMQFDKDKEDIDDRARPPLVVPPRLDLPAPKQVAHNPDWPKDADVEERRHAAAAAQRPAPQITPNTRVEMSANELQSTRGDLPKEGPPDECQVSAGTPICLYTPWQILQSVTGLGGGKPNSVEVGDAEPGRTYLTEPPSGYRKPTGTATATIEAPKEAPDAADTQAYVRSQQHKVSVDQ